MPELNILIEKVKEAGKLLLDLTLSSNVHVKGDADFVTEADMSVQKYLQSELGKLYPDVKFVGEESESIDYDPESNVFILDPVDGTTNLMHGYRNSVVSLGYYEKGVGIYGVLYNPFLSELYTAERGCGAYLNGEKIHAKKRENMEDCLAIVEFSPYYKERSIDTFEMMRGLFEQVQDIRSIGAAAIGLVTVACGRADIFLSKRLKPWDYAAAQVVLLECGCKVSSLDGRELPLGSMGHVIAATEGVYDKLLAYAKKFAE